MLQQGAGRTVWAKGDGRKHHRARVQLVRAALRIARRQRRGDEGVARGAKLGANLNEW